MKRILFIFYLIIISINLYAVDFYEILKKIDERNNFNTFDFTGLFTIITESSNQEKELIKLKLYRRDRNKQFLIIFQYPEINRGQGYLKDGNNYWLYDRVSRKFTHTSIRNTINDTNVKGIDFCNVNLFDNYEIISTRESKIGNIEVWVIFLKSKNNNVEYNAINLYISKDYSLIIKQEDLSVSGKIMRTIWIPKYINIGNEKIFPHQMLIIDELNNGKKNQITLEEISIDSLPDSLFTKTYLETIN